MKSFLIQPFAQRIHVTGDPEEFTRRYNQYAEKDKLMLVSELNQTLGMACCQEHPKKGVLFLMYVSPQSDESVLYHESLHMAHFVMDYVNAPINLDSTETQAYLLTHIAEAVRKKLS